MPNCKRSNNKTQIGGITRVGLDPMEDLRPNQ